MPQDTHYAPTGFRNIHCFKAGEIVESKYGGKRFLVLKFTETEHHSFARQVFSFDTKRKEFLHNNLLVTGPQEIKDDEKPLLVPLIAGGFI